MENNTTALQQFLEIALKDIILVSNYRNHDDITDNDEFKASILKHGVLQPIILRPKGKKYELVCGMRRFLASKAVQKRYPERNTIPATVRELTDDEVFEIQIIENLQRKDVHPMDEAVAYKAMAEKDYSIETIAAKIDKSTKYVANRLKLNDLIPALQELFFTNVLNLGHCLELCKVSASAQQDFLNDEVCDGEYSGNVAQIKKDLSYSYKDLSYATFDLSDKNLLASAPACTACLKNTACQQLLFPGDKAQCTDGACYAKKESARFYNSLEFAKLNNDIVFVDTANEKDGEGSKLRKEGHVVFNINNVRFIDAPEIPVREDYDGNNETEAEDVEEFNHDMVNFKAQMQKYEEEIKTANKCFVVGGYRKGQEQYYRTIISSKSGANDTTNNDIALLAELEAKLERNAANDDKQVMLHMSEALCDANLMQPQKSNSTEWTLLRYLVLDVLHYTERDKYFEIINKEDLDLEGEDLFLFLMGLSNVEFLAMLRLTLIDRYSNADPESTKAFMLRKLADELGIDIHKLVMDQKAVALTRDAKLQQQIKGLKEKLKPANITPKTNKVAAYAK